MRSADYAGGLAVTRVVITGGREFADWDLMNAVMDGLRDEHDITEIAHGGQKAWMPLTSRWRGADYYAGQWAESRGMPCQEFKVSEGEWRLLQKAAGPVRNRRMLDEFKPDMVIAFPGGKGTKDCCEAAQERHITVLAVSRTRDGSIDIEVLGPDRLF